MAVLHLQLICKCMYASGLQWLQGTGYNGYNATGLHASVVTDQKKKWPKSIKDPLFGAEDAVDFEKRSNFQQNKLTLNILGAPKSLQEKLNIGGGAIEGGKKFRGQPTKGVAKIDKWPKLRRYNFEKWVKFG